MENSIELRNEMLSIKKWALLGATPDKSKFGYKILKKLEKKGYVVYGVNPKYDEIDGSKIYKSLKDIKQEIESVNVIVNPSIAIKAIDEIYELGIKNVWFQPGSFNEEVIGKAREKGLNIIYDACLYVELS